MLKKIIILIITLLALIIFNFTIVNAENTEIYTTTSVINGVTVSWSYTLNELNQIENLKCTNPADLVGSIDIPSVLDGKTVTQIGDSAFKNASNITGITIPSSITNINAYSFMNCTSLINVNLGNVQSISYDAFKNCTALESITIPKTLKSAGTIIDPVFAGCTKLTTIVLEEGLTVVPSFLCASTNITSIEIPSSVTEIEYYAFNNCNELKEITILDNVEKIGWFILYPTTDTVFQNHNEDLTIYCYEGSKIAEYAIATNIKYVYLPRETTESPIEDDKNSTTGEDNTVAQGNLPHTGVYEGIVMLIVIVAGVSAFIYFKYSKVKDIY